MRISSVCTYGERCYLGFTNTAFAVATDISTGHDPSDCCRHNPREGDPHDDGLGHHGDQSAEVYIMYIRSHEREVISKVV